MQREHPLAPETLVERMLRRQEPPLGDQRGVPPERKLRVEPCLDRLDAQFFQPRDLVTGEGIVSEGGQLWAAP
jgi:hypothetical protein